MTATTPVTVRTCTPLPVVGGPKDGATFTPLFDVVAGQVVRLGAWQVAGGRYVVSNDGRRVEWVVA